MAGRSPIDLSKGQWQYFRKELIARTKEPLGSVPFVFYVVMSIFFFGALGIWIEVVRYLTQGTHDAAPIFVAMIAFFSALIGTSAVQLAYDSHDELNKIMLAFAILLLVMFSVFAVALSILGVGPVYFVFNLVCSLSAVWVWWIANAKTKTFTFLPDASTGGDPTRQLDGNVEGFKV